MTKFQNILFDLDGTLTDSGPGITRSAQYALGKLGIDEPDLVRLRTFVGPPLSDSFVRQHFKVMPYFDVVCGADPAREEDGVARGSDKDIVVRRALSLLGRLSEN